ncbi:MAG: hypothetical protein WCL06_06660, partial [Bacteroidota bacterium]
MTGTVTGGTSTNMIIGGTGGTISMPAFTLNNVTINRASGVTLFGDVNLVGTLTLTSGTLIVGTNILTLSNQPVRTNGFIDASNGSTLLFTNASAISLPASIFSAAINNLTINGAGGITSPSDITINGILNLQSANPTTTKGLLDMWDGSAMKTLTMGAAATTVGTGDVSGLVKRNSFVASTEYTFGSQLTSLTFANSGTMPTEVIFKISMGTAPSWKSSAVKRTYDIIRTGGSGTTVTLSLHYLDSEIQSNTETNLVIWDYHTDVVPIVDEEHGKANQNTTNNWVAISNRNITYFATTFDTHRWYLSDKVSANFVWQGTPSSDWNDPNNWSGGVIPSATSDVVIPDAATTIHDPGLPASPSAMVKTIIIQPGGILEGDSATTLTIAGSAGAWLNMGTFNPGTSNIIFTHANATMADPTNFYNLTIANGAGLTPETNNYIRIAGTLTNNGTLRAALLPNTIEFNGTNQTIINPNGLTPGYYHLVLSGSGTKTLPSSALTVYGDLTISGTTTVNAASSIHLSGELTIGENCTFNTGNYDHFIGEAFDNSGIFNASPGYSITLNGSTEQSIYGLSTSSFDKLTIENSSGVKLLANATVNNVLALTSGNLNVGGTTLGINGTIIKTNGSLDVNSQSSLNFGGTSALSLPNDLFANTPSLNNLRINRTGGVSLSNQGITING